MLLLQLLIGPLDWTRKIETTPNREKKYIARNHATMKTRDLNKKFDFGFGPHLIAAGSVSGPGSAY